MKQILHFAKSRMQILAFLGLLILFTGPLSLFSVPTPQVELNVPTEVLIGEEFTFTVTFQNNGGNGEFGYGPFIDLAFDYGGADIGQANCFPDGIQFISASMVGVNGGPISLTSIPSPNGIITTPSGSSGNPFNHTFLVTPNQQVTIIVGGQFVTLELPFGSFDNSQPPIVIQVLAKILPNADIGTPLKISARGGFRYGSDPLDNPSTNEQLVSAWEDKFTKPQVVIITKKFLGKEDECATGPNFTSNYPGYHLQYQINVDIANGQQIDDFVIWDFWADNMNFNSFISYNPTPIPNIDLYPENFKFRWWNSLIGGTQSNDATVIYDFFIPENIEHGTGIGNEILTDCEPEISKNTFGGHYEWIPQPSTSNCDEPIEIQFDNQNAHILKDKSIAIQKEVSIEVDNNAQGPSPGDILRYTINFQISDYKTVGKIQISDFLPDGQELLLSAPFKPYLKAQDKFNQSIFGEFILGTDLSFNFNPEGSNCSPIHGETLINFKVSSKISTSDPINNRHQAGILTGGYASNLNTNIPAYGRVIFYARILDKYRVTSDTTSYPPVVKHDPVDNCVTISGDILSNVLDPQLVPNLNTVECNATDDSHSSLSIVSSPLRKSVYVVRRVPPGDEEHEVIWGPNDLNNLPIPQIIPGDWVTFRIEKSIPTGDAINVEFTDWLPLPIFNVSTFPTSFTNIGSIGIPSPGSARFLTPWLGPTTPQYRRSVTPTNSLDFNFGTFNNPTNTEWKIDVLFTVEATNAPFADGLYLTNEVTECEKNTLGTNFCETAIAQVQMTEPKVRITKGVIATNNPNSIFTPSAPPNGFFSAPNSSGNTCPRFTTPITSANLASLNMNSNAMFVDAGDLITYAIVIENTGTGAHGAFDVQIRDCIPLGPDDTPCSSLDLTEGSLCISRGDGTIISSSQYTISNSGQGCFTITFNDPSTTQGILFNYDPLNQTGKNIIIITFNATIPSNFPTGCCDNNISLLSYSNENNGDNFVTAGFGGPFSDPASICSYPNPYKKIQSTSESFTTGTNPVPVAIGEIVRYRLEIAIPESSIEIQYKIKDLIPSGLMYIEDGTTTVVTVSNQVPIYSSIGIPNVNGNSPVPPTWPLPISQILPISINCGTQPTFDLGKIKNLDNDPDKEYIVLEFNALVCNVTGNQSGINLVNNFIIYSTVIFLNGVESTTTMTSNNVAAKILEPELYITKTVTPNPVEEGQGVTYTVTIENVGNTIAHDVQFIDVLPPELVFTPGSLVITGAGASCWLPTTIPTVSALCVALQPNLPVTIKYMAATNPNEVTCPEFVTNNADVFFTSLPGPFGTTNNPTGSAVIESAGEIHGERDGSDGQCNDYLAHIAADLQVTCPPCVTPLPQGMVGWWTLDEPTGANAHDIAPAPFSLIDNFGTAVPSSGFYPGSINGKVDMAKFFPGKMYYTVPTQSELDFGINDFSIDAWVFSAQCGSGLLSPIVDKFDNTINNGTGFSLYLDQSTPGNAKILFRLNTITCSSSGTLNTTIPGTWYHIAVTVNRSMNEIRFYIDGLLAGTYTNSSISSMNVNNSLPMWIGNLHYPTGNGICETGIDELELFNQVLSATDVERIYVADVEGKCKFDLSIQKDAQNTPWVVGDNRTFTVTAQNVGSEPIPTGENLFVYEYLPTGLTVTSISGNGWVVVAPTGGAPYIGPATIKLKNTLTTDLLPGVTLPVITFNVNVTAIGPYQNCVKLEAISANNTALEEPMNNNVHCIDIPSGCVPPPPCMLNWWTFDETSGNSSQDIRGYNNIGTWIGNPLAVTGSNNSMVAGALKFTGTNYVEVPDHYELNFGTGDFSVDFWIRSNDTNGVQKILEKMSGTYPNQVGYSLYFNHGWLQLDLADGTNTTYGVSLGSSSAFICDDTWHLIAVTIERGSSNGVIIYKDGNPLFTFNPNIVSGSITNSVPLKIGTDLKATLDEFEMFCCVLNPTDIMAIYDAGPSGKCKTTSIDEFSDLEATGKSLIKSYPNPFNHTATIEYNIPYAGYVRMIVTDILGKEIAVLVNEVKIEGEYKTTFNGKDLPSGSYFIQLHVGEYQETKEMKLVK